MAGTGVEPVRVVAVIQSILRAGGSSITVDGQFGPATDAALTSASDVVKGQISAYLDSVDLTLDNVRPSPKARASKEPPPIFEARALVARVAEEEGVPPKLALKVCGLESRFVSDAISPTGYKGLFQLGTYAMTDVKNSDASLVDWEEAGVNRYGTLWKMVDPFNAEQNARVGCRYLKLIAKAMKVSLDDYAKVYLGFNIGAVGARDLLAGRTEKVSKLLNANPKYARYGHDKYFETLSAEVAKA